MLHFTALASLALALPIGSGQAPGDEERAWLDAIRAGLAAGGATRPAEGRGQVEGEVLDADGRGVAGVMVRLQVVHSSPRGDLLERSRAPGPSHLAASLASTATFWARSQTHSRTVTTDEAGAFAIDGLPEGEVNGWAYLDGWHIRPRWGSRRVVEEDGPPTRLTFDAVPIHRMRVDVRLADGSTPERAWTLVTYLEGWREQQPWTAAEPTICFAGATAEVIAFADPLLPLDPGTEPFVARQRSHAVFLSSDRLDEVATLTLLPERGVYGQVIDAEGRFEGSEVAVLLEHERDRRRSDTRGWSSSSRGKQLRTQQGRYAAMGLERGRYVLTVAGADPVTVTIGEGFVQQDIVVRPGERGRELLVRALDSLDRPVQLRSVQLEWRLPPGGTSTSNAAIWPSLDGGHWVDLTDAVQGYGEASAELVAVVARSSRLGTVRAACKGIDEEVVLRFNPPAHVAVRLDGLARLPSLLGVQVDAAEVVPDRKTRSTTTHRPRHGELLVTDADGRVWFDALQPGTYEFALRRSSGDRQHEQLARGTFEVRSGQNEVALTVPELSRLTLSVPALVPGARVGLSGYDDGNDAIRRDGVVDADWTITFEDLVHGRYRVHETQVLERNHPSPLLVTVPAPGGVVTIE